MKFKSKLQDKCLLKLQKRRYIIRNEHEIKYIQQLYTKGTDEEHDGWLNDAIVCAFMQYIIKQSVCNNSLNTMGKKNIYLFTYLFTLHINDVNCDFN